MEYLIIIIGLTSMFFIWFTLDIIKKESKANRLHEQYMKDNYSNHIANKAKQSNVREKRGKIESYKSVV